MATLNPANAKVHPPTLLALSDFVAGLHECQLGSRLAFMGEADEDITIHRSQVLVVTSNAETDEDGSLQPEMILAAGPLGMRIGGVRLVNAEASAERSALPVAMLMPQTVAYGWLTSTTTSEGGRSRIST